MVELDHQSSSKKVSRSRGKQMMSVSQTKKRVRPRLVVDNNDKEIGKGSRFAKGIQAAVSH